MSKKRQKKTRTDWAYATLNVTEGGIVIRYDPADDTVEFVGADPGSLKTERSYERASGKPKIVSSIPSVQRASLDADRSVMVYDAIVAIDTNTRLLHGKRCGICFSYYVAKPPNTYREGIPFQPLGLFLIYGLVEGVNAERIGWHLTLTHHLATYRQEQHGPLAVVVDSELGLRPAINARTIGYYADHRLPPGAAMIYASADTDTDTLQGQMIRLCDAMATQAADAIAAADLANLTQRDPGDGDYEWSAAIHIPSTSMS
ncbi:MAG: hypothetical protein EOO77_02450 [Oxalobacteraceae bacterium]|nr:MAG: hypothetical protein EOO77_02450 [Oxalobacteraceae bacterium]